MSLIIDNQNMLSMWKDLSMAQKSELMKIFLQSGMRSLSEMQAYYDDYASRKGRESNKFGDGGPTGNVLGIDANQQFHLDELRSKKEANDGHLFDEGGNIYGLGDWLDKAKSVYHQTMQSIGLEDKPQRKIKYQSWDGKRFDTATDAARHNGVIKRGIEKGVYYDGRRYGDGIMKRNPNTSSTRQMSTLLENTIYNELNNRYFGGKGKRNQRTQDFEIPYGDKTIVVQENVSSPKQRISINALDSIAKYAGMAKIPIQWGLGLAGQETMMGKQPLYNQGKNSYFNDTEQANADYFKAFGSIPAEYLVRDFRYNSDITDKKGRRDEPIPLSTPPLLHAFEFFKSGKYNPGDKNHTSDVKRKGNALWNERRGELLNWWNTEGKYWYNGTYK